MHLANIQATCLKGSSFSHGLAQLTLIAAPNFAHKSTILEAVQILLLGFCPEPGKSPTPKTTFDTYSSGSEMQVDATKMPGGIRLQRRFALERGSVKHAVSFDPAEYQTPLLNSDSWASMTESARIQYVFERVQLPPSFTVDGIIARLQREVVAEDHSEEFETAKVSIIANCRDVLIRETTHTPNQLPHALTLLTSEVLKEEFTRWNGRAKDTAAAVRTLTELKLREPECSAETLADLRTEVERLDAELQAAQKQLGALQQQAAAAQRSQRRREELQQKLQQPAVNNEDLIANTKWELEKVLAQAAPLGGEDAPDALPAITAYHQSLTKLTGQEQALSAANKEIDSICAKKCCPFCKSEDEGWRDRVLSVLTLTRNKLTADTVALRDTTEELRIAASKAKTASEAWQQRRTLSTQLTLQAAKLRERVTALEAQQQQGARLVIQWAEELAALVAEPAPATEEFAEISDRVRELIGQRAEAAMDVSAAERLQHDIRRAAQAAAEHRAAAARAAAIKATGLVLRAVKAEAVAAAFGSILDRANRLCQGVLPARLCYDVEKSEIGFIGKSGFYSHRSSSGSEKALAYIAISAALAAESPFRLLLLDELFRLVPSLQLKVLENFRQAVESGDLDQCICCLPWEQEEDPVAPGWTLLRLGQEVAA